jgi:spermidine synthase
MARLGRRLFIYPLYGFVFATGAAGLVYEVTWQRYLSRLMGSEAIATAVIMGVFLGGLSLGYFLCGRLSARVASPLKAYALLEAIVAAWGLLFPTIFGAFSALTASWSFEPPVWMIAEGALGAFLLIGVPTICMGATVPMLTRGVSPTLRESTGVHARLYGVNTAGAFVGTLVAGFCLIPALGLPLTVMGTALVNLGAAVFFFLISRSLSPAQEGEGAAPEGEPAIPSAPAGAASLARPRVILYAVAFLSGFYVMTLENVLIRVANLSFGASSYSFALVLSVFLLAIAVGSLCVDRMRRLGPRTLFLNQLVLLSLLVGLFAILDLAPYLAHLVRIAFQPNASGFVLYYVAVFLAIAAVLALPLSFAGATLPLAFHELKQRLDLVGRHSGTLLSWNTFGSLTGSLVGGIVLFSLVDCPRVFLVAIAGVAASLLLVSLQLGRAHRAAAACLLAAATVLVGVAPSYDVGHFLLGTFRTRAATPESYLGPTKFFEAYDRNLRTLFYDDDAMSSVAAVETIVGERRSRAIVVNGKCDSDTAYDAYTMKLLAHFAVLFAKEPRSALVVGVGTGVTLGEIARYRAVERIDAAEISPSVIAALPLFAPFTGGVDRDPRLRIHAGDAFRVIGRGASTWDIIVSEPSNPWVTGVDALYSVEFYELVRRHLNPGGVFVQWIHIYDSSDAMLGMVANTIRSEFTDVNVFVGGDGDILFLASAAPITSDDLRRAKERLAAEGAARRSLDELEIASLDGLLLRQVWSSSFLDDRFYGRGLQTLDNPRLHYLAGRAFFEGTGIRSDDALEETTAYYWDEYLIAREHPDWPQRPVTRAEVEAAYAATRLDLPPKVKSLRTSWFLDLKARLADPSSVPREEQAKNGLSLPLIALSGARAGDDAAWAAVGLGGVSLRKKAEAMLEQLRKWRRWVDPYPIDGLKATLREGLERSDGAARNWFGLTLACILLRERAPDAEIASSIGELARDGGGRIVIGPGDEALLDDFRKLAVLRERRRR